jgi:hypothetical protein
MSVIAISEVGPFVGETEETIGYRGCDFCYETACEDIWAGRIAESEWRRFYEVLGEGLTCCENCLPELFK